MGSAARDDSGAARVQVSSHAALIVLLLCAVLTAGAAYLVATDAAGSQLLGVALPLPLVLILAFGLTRHVMLALVATIAPAAGVLWGEGFGILVHAPPAIPALALAFGSVLSLMNADNFSARILDGDDPKRAARAAATSTWRPLLGSGVLAFALLAVVVRDPWFRQISLSAFMQFAFSGVAAVVILWSASQLLSFSESFVARLNRARETRIRRAYAVSMISMPRWGLSITGIGLVAAILGFFGAEEMLTRSAWAVPIVAFLVLLLSLGLSGRWRNALGLVFSAVVTALIGFWSWTELKSHGLLDVIALIEAVAVGFALMLAVLSRERALGATHNDSVARLLAVEEMAAPTLYASLAALAPTALLGGAGGLAAVVLVAGALCALLVVPAAATALDALIPRRKSVSELYGAHP